MRKVLTDKDLTAYEFPSDVVVERTSIKTIENYDNDATVVAIAGSRAMSIEVNSLNLPSLKLFQLTSAGFDYVPTEDFAKKGVFVSNAGSVYSNPIAETVVFGILLMAKKLRKNPNNRRFKFTRGYTEITELADKKVLIMGAGNIGTAVANRLSGFEMQIDAYDPYCTEKPQYATILRNREELLNAISQYDYVVSTMPDNAETKGFFDNKILSSMKSTAVIVNVGRKAVFNQDHLYYALKTKKIGGAVLDMFEKLPNPITNKFRRLRNVVVLPGVAAISREVNSRLKDHMYKNISAVLSGNSPQNVINGVK